MWNITKVNDNRLGLDIGEKIYNVHMTKILDELFA
jgi:hypothetical protein